MIGIYGSKMAKAGVSVSLSLAMVLGTWVPTASAGILKDATDYLAAAASAGATSTAPKVSIESITPVNGQSAVTETQAVKVELSTRTQEGTNFDDIQLTTQTNKVIPVDAKLVEGGREISIQPQDSTFGYGTTYTVTVPTQAVQGLDASKSSTFTVRSGPITQISAIPLERFAPAIYDKTIAWVEKSGADYEIFVAQVNGGKVQSIYQATEDQWDQAYPSIYDNKLVWDDNRNGKRNIVLMTNNADKASRQTTVYTSAYHETDPCIYGNRVVFQRKMADGTREIVYYELDQSNNKVKEVVVTNNKLDDVNPVLYGDTIVWQRKNAETGWDIYTYKIGSSVVNGEELYAGSGDQVYPSVDGYKDGNTTKIKVVWEDRENPAKSQIYYTTIGEDTVYPVAASDNNQIDPVTSNGDVVWSEQQANGKWAVKIFIAQRAKNPKGPSPVEFVSEADELNHYFPAIYLGSVIWTTEESIDHENVFFRIQHQIDSPS